VLDDALAFEYHFVLHLLALFRVDDLRRLALVISSVLLLHPEPFQNTKIVKALGVVLREEIHYSSMEVVILHVEQITEGLRVQFS
jgi:hypothetical protein